MPKPTLSEVHYDEVLSEISVAYIQKADRYIAAKVFPVVEVSHRTGKFRKWNKNDWHRIEAKKRAPGTESAGSGFGFDSYGTYSCDTWAIHHDVPREHRANADFDLLKTATLFVTDQLLKAREKAWADAFFKAGVWGTDWVGGTDFTAWDQANSTPIEDIQNAKLKIEKSTGYTPNVLVLGVAVYETLKNHDSIIERYKYTQEGIVTADLLARVFDVDRIVVPRAIYATNEEGASESYDFMFNNHALLVYVPDNPSLLTPAGGYIFTWTGEGLPGYEVTIARLEMPWKKAERVEGEANWDMQLVSSDVGLFFQNAVTAI